MARFDYSVAEIAGWLGGKVEGDGEKRILGIRSLVQAGPEEISFVRDPKYLKEAAQSQAGALIVPEAQPDISAVQIVVTDAFAAMAVLLTKYEELGTPRPKGVSSRAEIAEGVELGEGVAVGAFTVIEEGAKIGVAAIIYGRVYIGHDTEIGAGTIVYPQVSIRERVTIGERCVIHSGTVIGDDGFGYLQRDGRHLKIPQIGTVVLGNDVEVGSICTIDRAALDETRIGDGVKIDNHSHIAHNVDIGEHSLLVAYAKIAGSVKIGKGVTVAEDCGINDHAVIGDGAIIGGGSNVYQKKVGPGEVLWGSPAKPIQLEKKIQALIKRLPEYREKIRDLEKRVKELEGEQ